MRCTRRSGRWVLPVVNRSLRNGAVLLVALALMLTVITRFTDGPSNGAQLTGFAVHQNLENKHQHIQNTSFVRLVALADLVRLELPAIPQVAVVDTPAIKILYGEDLYNRPPPFLS